MRISLPKDVEAFLEEQQADLENLLLEATEKPVKPVTQDDFAAIRKRLRRK